MTSPSPRPSPEGRGGWIVAISLLVIVTILIAPYLPAGIDWRNTYRPATLAVMRGENPYGESIFYAAPWSVIPLMPFAMLPYPLGRAGTFMLGLCIFAWTSTRLGARRWTFILFMTSAAVIGCLNNGNIEWLGFFGFALPPMWGLLLVMVKPQIGIGIAFFWLAEAWRTGGIRKAVWTFAPVTCAFLISFWMYGLWPLRFSSTLRLSVDNEAVFPFALCAGLALIAQAIRARDERFAIGAGPFLAPYVLQFTWGSVLLALVTDPLLCFAVWIGLWLVVIIRIFL